MMLLSFSTKLRLMAKWCLSGKISDMTTFWDLNSSLGLKMH